MKFTTELLYFETKSMLRNTYCRERLIFFKFICGVQNEDNKIESILFSTLPLI